ncbi:NUDIX hydrolase [Caldalkalibacillus mannanilyticus]|uniref:NUDIX hydrolase n=1 Tax=Caldalkalibacillus mannanilyticus TaxID=1418 RepID=UPI000469B29E|nr:NUDIX hydrolase [Caldalkalibacillus mannanilyticus]
MTNFTEKTLRIEPIFTGKVIQLQVEEIELPNGKTATREVVKHPGAVAIIPFTHDGRLVLIRQYRKPLEKEIYEIPAGKLEPSEKPEVCAIRELEEETGYQAESFEKVVSFYTSPGFANELLYIYVAKGLKGGTAQPDEDEFVENRLVTLAEALELIAEEKIHDAKTIFAVTYWQNQLLKEQLGVQR